MSRRILISNEECSRLPTKNVIILEFFNKKARKNHSSFRLFDRVPWSEILKKSSHKLKVIHIYYGIITIDCAKLVNLIWGHFMKMTFILSLLYHDFLNLRVNVTSGVIS